MNSLKTWPWALNQRQAYDGKAFLKNSVTHLKHRILQEPALHETYAESGFFFGSCCERLGANESDGPMLAEEPERVPVAAFARVMQHSVAEVVSVCEIGAAAQ
ncbi:cytochrome oxidase subunit mitochondrion, putative [Babesia ovata]|uniref:Cytochrome oxidase subunit mitochondrion, putative n=1 Tax=Babesia ovata TaxID=189622 RepID=A0A2H6KFS9_9APIC|nr:cytochrome oxidase subunit mitochondrion, putative [Babesia ovata]GBE61834.1 cytochrome oxidase subunit mitochondrion, putative [Babesia ovata]